MKIKHILHNNIYMLRYVYKYRKSHIALTLFSAIMGSISPVISLMITRHIINTISGGKNDGLFGTVIAFVVLLVVYNIVLLIINSHIAQRVIPKNTQIIHQKMQMELFEKAKSVELHCYEDAEFYNRFSMAMAQSDGRALAVLNTLVSFLSSLFGIGALTALVSIIEPIVIVISLINVAISFYINTKSMKVQHEFAKTRIPIQRETEYVKRVFYLQDFAKEIRLFPAFGKVMKVKYNEAVDKSLLLVDKYGRKFERFTRIQGIFNTILNSGVTLYLAYKVIDAKLLLGDFVTASSGAQQLSGQITSLLNTFPQMYEHNLYIENFREFIEYKPSISDNSGTELDKIESIKLENVSFTYPKTEREVLRNISLHINAGERIAIVGRNGAGKSTLVKLIARLYEPNNGKVTSGECCYSDINVNSLRNNIGIVFQDYKAFSVSIAENILMRPIKNVAEDEKMIYAALNFVGLYEKVMSLPEGIYSIMTREFSNEGIFLSGGEMQKLALARVYARNCSLIILDEPSSALDPIAENEMFSRMRLLSKDKCAVMISHRLSNIMDADRIYVIDEGEIVEQGCHSELMDMGGLYFGMYSKQNGNSFTKK